MVLAHSCVYDRAELKTTNPTKTPNDGYLGSR
eukprot:COSAG01_NODE_59107_length_302_cov_0.753695_1_plen_31_part_10